MKRNQKGPSRRAQTLQVWTYRQLHGALAYIGSVMRSVREYRLEAQAQHLRATRLGARPGRPDRSTLIAHKEALTLADRAAERCREAMKELKTLDVFCIDPIEGQAFVPFVHDNKLAWFLYELFEEDHLRYWRYHSDPLESRRPIAELQAGNGPSIVV